MTLDQETNVLYPKKRCIFDITRASDKLMKVHCRDDPSIFGTRQVEDSSTLRASESFGSFGVEVAEFLQKEQVEVEREKSLQQKRKGKMEEELQKVRLDGVYLWFPISSSCTAMSLGMLVLWTCLDPGDEAYAAGLCVALVLSLALLSFCSFFAQMYGLRSSGSRWNKLIFSGPYGCFFLGSITVTIAIVRYVIAGFWWTVLAAGLPCCCISTLMCLGCCVDSVENTIKWNEEVDKQRVAHRTIVFHGKVLSGTGPTKKQQQPEKKIHSIEPLFACRDRAGLFL